MICRLLGYERSNQYILWKSGRDIIIYARDVIIDKWNTIYNKNDNEMEDVSELYKSQLENSPSQPEDIENLLYKSGNEIEDVSELYKI